MAVKTLMPKRAPTPTHHPLPRARAPHSYPRVGDRDEQRLALEEFDRSLNLGYLDEPVWIRIDLAGSSEELTMLEVAYPNLDAIDAFYVRDGEVISQVETGDRSLFAERAWPHRNFIFPLDSEAEFIYLACRPVPRCRSAPLLGRGPVQPP